ncbi:MAG: helix-turn-helix transcriptional regulator [Candidatus Falkowbacteria bacterium]
MNSKKIKLTSFDEILEKEMRDPEFRKYFELETKKLEIAMKINELRKKKKISQAKLAEKIGMKQSAIGRIEIGEQNLTIETLSKIASALNKKLEVKFV